MFASIQLFFLAFYVIEALLPLLIINESPAGYKGITMGVYYISQFLGVTFGGMPGSFLFQLQGCSWCFWRGRWRWHSGGDERNVE
ncbi:hypothetical protein BG74_08600 [Sodalis-like endosymbiont of Proechinophthirus fluctus]|nr:hypothetical protein BG74_08600 [Sodalis-like endosymbiont of Proechinophthirus fluctus]